MFTQTFETKTPSDCCMGWSLLCIFLSICLVMCFGVFDAADLRDGLINYWPLDGDATDSIGKHDGEVIGGPKWVNARIGKGSVLVNQRNRWKHAKHGRHG
ncbi:MAG: hypothetical protein OXI63_17225 [Candidatus Poribacteria bacterium]|nr:hypothetical protein [Candidatus Poribacteria bacterium]